MLGNRQEKKQVKFLVWVIEATYKKSFSDSGVQQTLKCLPSYNFGILSGKHQAFLESPPAEVVKGTFVRMTLFLLTSLDHSQV